MVIYLRGSTPQRQGVKAGLQGGSPDAEAEVLGRVPAVRRLSFLPVRDPQLERRSNPDIERSAGEAGRQQLRRVGRGWDAWQPGARPKDQPGWARPILFGVALLSAALYAWRAGTYLEVYYAAAVRSMSMSWHNFFFAAFDPTGTVTLDKLPGAFWIQALSVRVFGVQTWAIVLPQVVEGVLSVLVLYRIVRRLCGPVAGLLGRRHPGDLTGDGGPEPGQHLRQPHGPAAPACR